MEAVVVTGFEWDDDNILHIARHQFSPNEVEEVFAGEHKVGRTREKRYIALGETLDGRLAFVVFRRAPGGLIRGNHGAGHGRQRAAAIPPQVGGSE